MLQSLCVELSERSYGSSTGQGERSSVERHIAAGLLHNTVRQTQQQIDEKNGRFILFISLNTW